MYRSKRYEFFIDCRKEEEKSRQECALPYCIGLLFVFKFWAFLENGFEIPLVDDDDDDYCDYGYFVELSILTHSRSLDRCIRA